jgi:hypothetical protein
MGLGRLARTAQIVIPLASAKNRTRAAAVNPGFRQAKGTGGGVTACSVGSGGTGSVLGAGASRSIRCASASGGSTGRTTASKQYPDLETVLMKRGLCGLSDKVWRKTEMHRVRASSPTNVSGQTARRMSSFETRRCGWAANCSSTLITFGSMRRRISP